ncbi:MAG: Tetraspanin family-domain-containing protein [Podila humilis]|nr:MAG: Tetraspanin family-domain-containing protein [Podila humilis]
MAYNQANTADRGDPVHQNHRSHSSFELSSDNDVTASGSPYLEFLNTSFSTDQDLSLPDRVITPSPLLENANSPYSNTGRNGSNLSTTPRDRILNSLFKRGSKETLSTASSSSPRISNKPQATQRSNANNSVGALSQHQGAAMSEGSTGSLSPSLASSSPVPPKSILKSKPQGTQANALPSIPYSTRPQQPQPSRSQDAHLQYLLTNDYNNNNHNTNNTCDNMNHNRFQPQSQPLHSQQQHYTQPLSPLSAPQPMLGNELGRPASPFAMGRSDSPSGRLGGAFGGTNTSSLSSTHRSSKQLAGPGMDSNYNMTESDTTLEGLAERWRSYQALMRKRYAEEPFFRRWTRSKWMLLFSSLLMLGYSVAVLVVAVGYQSGRFENAEVAVEFHSKIIHLAMAASIAGIATAAVGLYGIVRENRVWLSWYTFLLWPVFALYVAVGYEAFKGTQSNRRARLRNAWTNTYTREQRLLVQKNLKCCGFQDPSYFGAYDLRCFPMTNLPGCQHKYNQYEYNLLTSCWTYSFSIAPVQLFVMVVALLCSNHVDGMLRSGRPGLKSFKEE